jgi:anti-anti-sigma factor
LPKGVTVESGQAYAIREEHVLWDGRLLAACGELDLAAAPALREWLTKMADAGARRIVLDLRGVTFIDSLSFAAIVAGKHRLGDDTRLAVVADQPYVLLILEAGGLDSVVAVFSTREEAVEHVLGGS